MKFGTNQETDNCLFLKNDDFQQTFFKVGKTYYVFAVFKERIIIGKSNIFYNSINSYDLIDIDSFLFPLINRLIINYIKSNSTLSCYIDKQKQHNYYCYVKSSYMFKIYMWLHKIKINYHEGKIKCRKTIKQHLKNF
jgi:hypothetical protein